MKKVDSEKIEKARAKLERAYKKYGTPAFLFSEADLRQLLVLFWFGESESWLSHLDRIDQTDRLQRDRGMVYDRSTLPQPNILVQKFTHQQVNRCLMALAAKGVMRDSRKIVGWHEYALQVMVNKTDPACEENRGMPPVRKVDMVKAMIALSKEMSRVIDTVDYNPDALKSRSVENKNRLAALLGQL